MTLTRATMRRTAATAVLFVALGTGLAACGGDDGGSVRDTGTSSGSGSGSGTGSGPGGTSSPTGSESGSSSE